MSIQNSDLDFIGAEQADPTTPEGSPADDRINGSERSTCDTDTVKTDDTLDIVTKVEPSRKLTFVHNPHPCPPVSFVRRVVQKWAQLTRDLIQESDDRKR